MHLFIISFDPKGTAVNRTEQSNFRTHSLCERVNIIHITLFLSLSLSLSLSVSLFMCVFVYCSVVNCYVVCSVLPALIVAVTLGVTKTHGYASKTL